MSAVRYRVITMAAFLAVLQPRASFPCDIAESRPPRTSPWDLWGHEEGHLGPYPHIFAFSFEDVPSSITRNDQPINVDFALVRKPELLTVEGLFVFAPREPLPPGRYCVDYYCVDVTADGPAPSRATLSGKIFAREKGSSGWSCMSDCGPSQWPRSAGIQVFGITEELRVQVANWLVELSDAPDFSRNYIAVLAGAPLDIDMALRSEYDMDDFEQVCGQARAVLWDGTVTEPVDGGCAKFE